MEQTDGIGVAGTAEYFFYGTGLNDVSGIHNINILGVAGDDAQVMGDDHKRSTEALDHIEHEFKELRLCGDIERRRGFIGDQHLRVAGKGHSDHDSLPHTAAELIWIIVKAALRLGNTDKRQKLGRPVPGGFFTQLEMHE